MKKKGKVLGISIYPEKSGISETMEYIRLASKYGFTRIFANLLEVKDDEHGWKQIKTQTKIFEFAEKLGFEIILDVDPLVYKEFNLDFTETSFFKKMHVSGIRLDQDFKGKVETKLSHNKDNLLIELNASGSLDTFRAIKKNKGNMTKILACFNFYPQRHTGQILEQFISSASILWEYGVRVGAFITLHSNDESIGPWNVNDGMPTLESHRDAPIYKQVSDFLLMPYISDILFSQQGATESDFKEVKRAITNFTLISSKNVIDVKLKNIIANEVEKKILFNLKDIYPSDPSGHTHLKWKNEKFIRITYPRITYSKEKIEPNSSGSQYKKGDVIIMNKNKGKYKGEIHILLNDLDDTVENCCNKIAEVDFKTLESLSFIDNTTKINFVK